MSAPRRSAVDFVRRPINALIDMINGVIGTLNGISVDIPDWVPVWGGNTFGLSLPRIPRLAEGGIITGSSSGTLALIGEAGQGRDEAVIPLPPDWKTNGIGGMPSELVIVDADRKLIGRMQVEADGRIGRYDAARQHAMSRGYAGVY